MGDVATPRPHREGVGRGWACAVPCFKSRCFRVRGHRSFRRRVSNWSIQALAPAVADVALAPAVADVFSRFDNAAAAVTLCLSVVYSPAARSASPWAPSCRVDVEPLLPLSLNAGLSSSAPCLPWKFAQETWGMHTCTGAQHLQHQSKRTQCAARQELMSAAWRATWEESFERRSNQKRVHCSPHTPRGGSVGRDRSSSWETRWVEPLLVDSAQ